MLQLSFKHPLLLHSPQRHHSPSHTKQLHLCTQQQSKPLPAGLYPVTFTHCQCANPSFSSLFETSQCLLNYYFTWFMDHCSQHPTGAGFSLFTGKNCPCSQGLGANAKGEAVLSSLSICPEDGRVWKYRNIKGVNTISMCGFGEQVSKQTLF